MISYVEGNLLQANTEALVNTVNEVGIMGKGIALMFRDAFPVNNFMYEQACKRHEVNVGQMFVVRNQSHWGPSWIINFPTKKHWRNPSRTEWIRSGLDDLLLTIKRLGIGSVAVPPLGCGNGGLAWDEVRQMIVEKLGTLESVDIRVYVPTATYQNKPKVAEGRKLTPGRALIAEMIRRYGVLGFDCSLLEVQKLAWFLVRGFKVSRTNDPLKLHFIAGRYGPYADPLRHVLEALDGSFLCSDKRIADSSRDDVVSFNDTKLKDLEVYMTQAKMQVYQDALEWTQRVIDGFESPFGMELLATVDWIVNDENIDPTLESVRAALAKWPHSTDAAARKKGLFDDRVISIALKRILLARTFESSQRSLSLL